jgi:hypothetical protein
LAGDFLQVGREVASFLGSGISSTLAGQLTVHLKMDLELLVPSPDAQLLLAEATGDIGTMIRFWPTPAAEGASVERVVNRERHAYFYTGWCR